MEKFNLVIAYLFLIIVQIFDKNKGQSVVSGELPQ
jgi:hypothetical protein